MQANEAGAGVVEGSAPSTARKTSEKYVHNELWKWRVV